MILGGSDIETTGLLTDGRAGDHRIIEVYVGLWNTVTRERISQHLWRINPARSIAAAAQSVHGITIQDLASCPTWETVAPEVKTWLDEPELVVGHNWNGFDALFLNDELKRVGLAPLHRPTFDTMLEGRWATPFGKVPNLGELCFACGVDYDPAQAHRADYDVGVMMECFFKALDWGWFKPSALDLAAAA